LVYPVTIIKNACVSSCEVNTQSTSTSAEKEYTNTAVQVIERIYLLSNKSNPNMHKAMYS